MRWLTMIALLSGALAVPAAQAQDVETQVVLAICAEKLVKAGDIIPPPAQIKNVGLHIEIEVRDNGRLVAWLNENGFHGRMQRKSGPVSTPNGSEIKKAHRWYN